MALPKEVFRIRQPREIQHIYYLRRKVYDTWLELRVKLELKILKPAK